MFVGPKRYKKGHRSFCQSFGYPGDLSKFDTKVKTRLRPRVGLGFVHFRALDLIYEAEGPLMAEEYLFSSFQVVLAQVSCDS